MKNAMLVFAVVLLPIALCLTTCEHVFSPNEEIDVLYDVKVKDLENGAITAVPDKGMEGAEIKFIINPAPGYKLRSIQFHALGITNVDGGNVSLVYQNSQLIYFINLPKGGALVSGEFIPVSAAERSITLQTGEQGQVIVVPSSGVAGTPVRVYSYIEPGYSFKSGYPQLNGAAWTPGKEGFEFTIGGGNITLVSEFDRPTDISDILANARRAMNAEEFDTAFSFYEVAYQADKTNEEAILYSTLGKFIGIGAGARVRSLLIKAGMGNAPGTINNWLNLETVHSTNWLKIYTDDNNDTYKLPRLEPPGVFPGGFLNYDIDRNNNETRFGFDLRLFWNMIGNNPEGFNEYIETALKHIFGNQFEDACARAAQFPDGKTVTFNPALAAKFNLSELYGSGAVSIGRAELDILVAFFMSLKAAVEWLASYNWEMDLTPLRIEISSADSTNFLLNLVIAKNMKERMEQEGNYSLLSRVLPLRSQFLRHRNSAMMSRSKANFALAVSRLDRSMDAFYGRFSPEAKSKYAWLVGNNGFAKQLKTAMDSGGNFFLPEIPQYKNLFYAMEGKTSWVTSDQAHTGINLGCLFSPGYLAASRIIVTEPGGKAPVFFGFKGAATGAAIDNAEDIAGFDTFSLQWSRYFKDVFVKLKGKDAADYRWVYEIFPDFFVQENDVADRGYSKTNVTNLYEHYQRR